ncbi:MAG TPA: Ig-like domain-containing protein [Solirubrobacterales bacterium]
MKRGTLLAGLLAIALVALAVVLITSGGGGEEEVALKGQPFTGEPGVTRSVSSIKARQRYLDAHPEIDRRRDRALAAEEAAREDANEEAAREQGEASGEESASEAGEASAEESESEEQASGEEGEATGEEGERAGEAQAEGEPAAAEALADNNIREKPEPPGEGSMPPKKQASGSRLQRVGSAAITPSQAVNPSSTNFLGAQSNESGFIPPDSMGAVGPSQVLVFVNGRIKVFDKQGNLGGLNVSDSAFWAPVRNGSEPTDPGVEYDRLSQRWIVSGINTEDSNNRIMLAVSDGPTITSASDFTFFAFNQAAPPPSASPRFADYPQLGVDENAIYIGVNEFAAPPSTGFAGTSVYVIRKSSVMGAGPIVVTAFRNLVSGGQGPVSPQPATDMVPGIGSGYIVGPDASVFSQLDIRKIDDPGGNPTMSASTTTVPTTFAPTPFSVPAQGTTGGLDALDDRLFEAMIGRDPTGTPTLWTAHNILVNSSGASDPGGNRAAARWYQLGDLGATPSLVQSGTLFDPAASNPRWFWMPSIAMNGQGHASINTSVAGPTHRAEVGSSGRLFTDPLGTTEAFQITQNSTSAYNIQPSAPVQRWGDYSQTVVDPSDNMTFWTFQEYANANNSWGVRVIKLLAPPPATPSTASPATVPLGACSVAVDVEGTSTDGSGFFDPGQDPGGPGYPSHISASATGGVAVNEVTYTDPTHVTLDLDTRSATSSPADVTITNPDVQSVMATGLVTVDTAGTDPTVPCLNGTTPDSPNNDNNPKIFGTADASSTVTLYTDSGCAPGSEVGSGTASDFAAPGIAVDPVGNNSSTTYYATATDGSNNVSLCSSTLGTSAASETYVEDSIAPVANVTGGPIGLTNNRTPTFSFSAMDAVGPVSFECSIDTGTANYGTCSGPGDTHAPTNPLNDGSYTFRVRATDAAGNTSTEATRTFQVDDTPPSVSIDSGPSGATTDQSPTFTFSGSDTAGPVSFQCSIDTGTPSFRTCSGPGNSDTFPSPLAARSYTFRARATDQAGNSSVATRSFSVQTPKPAGAPETTITKGPKKTQKTRPKFKFTSSDPSAAFQCKLDKSQFAPCASPFKTPKLRPGKHKLQVRAVGAGGTDPTPAVRKFRILPPA